MFRITEASILILDTETTGVDIAEARVVELGGVLLEGGVVTQRLRTLVNPGIPIPAEASAVHRIFDADVAGAPSFAQVAPRLLDRLAGADALSGYNIVGYDLPVLIAEARRFDDAGHSAGPHGAAVWGKPVIDPLIFVRHHLRGLRERKLEPVAAHFGVRLTNAHSAVADCEATAGVLLAMVRRGLIPDDIDHALELQHVHAERQAREQERWSYWIYEDRQRPGLLRIGAGKHCGRPVGEVPPGYLDYLLNNVEDLPPAVRDEFGAALSRRASRAAR